jgi:tetratricopeptide (TPR) repeat protein
LTARAGTRRRLSGLSGLIALIGLAGCATANAGGETALAGEPLSPSPMGHFLAGRYATDQRDLGAAADLLSVALAADPANPDLLRDTYLATVSEGRMAEAADLARRLVAAGVEGTPARLTLALEAVKAGDNAAARDHLSRLPTDGFNGFIVPLLEAWVAFAGDDVDAALAITESDALKGVRGLEPVRGIQAGLIAELGGRPEAAAASFDSALAAAVNPPFRMVEIIGNYYQRNGRRDDAAALYGRFVAEQPGSVLAQALQARLAEENPEPVIGDVKHGLAEVLFDAASILRQEQATDIALIYTRMTLDMAPDMVLAQLVLADILEEQERHDAAIATYQALPAESPLSFQARLGLADLLDDNGRTDEAIELLRQMTAERPDQVDPPMQLGSVYRMHERFAEAADAYDIAVERMGEPTPDRWALFYFRGIAYERSGEWAKAEQDFLTALELSPDHPYVLNYLAYSWIEQGINYDRALDMLKQAVDLRPQDGFIVDSLGWVHYRLGQYDLAVQQLERANELQPTDPVLNDHLGDAYWRVGRRTEARFQWQRALLFNPEADQVPLIQAKITDGLGEPAPLPAESSGSSSKDPSGS